MKINFNIHTTLLGQECGLKRIEVVSMDDTTENSFHTDDGKLTFIINNDMIIYAPGMWALVTTSTEE